MLAKIMKVVCIVALILTALLWRFVAAYQLPLDLILCVGSLVVLLQAVRAGEYLWAGGFLIIAVAFNPVVVLLRPSGDFSLTVVLLCIPAFAMALIALKTPLLLSMPSITDRNPGSRSL